MDFTGKRVIITGAGGGLGRTLTARFAAAGAVAVRLGSNVLRSSSAGPAALAVMSAAGRWR